MTITSLDGYRWLKNDIIRGNFQPDEKLRYNTCLAAPTVTGKGHRKIEPKAKHFSHCKKDQSSRPNHTDNSKRLAKITNHT